MSWGEVRGHGDVVEELRRAMTADRFPHALLFVGPEGIGKRTFAERLARALLCERNEEKLLEPCEACAACRQCRGGTHPDLHRVELPEDRLELGIAVLRGLCEELALKPMSGVRKIALVDDADRLTEEASNAFLKTLEEPAPGSVVILIGTSPELLIETIPSRCRVVRFRPPELEEVAAILLELGHASDRGQAQELARRAEGSVSRAIGLAGAEFSEMRRGLLHALAAESAFDSVKWWKDLEAFVKSAGAESSKQRERAMLLMWECAGFLRGVARRSCGLDTAGIGGDESEWATRLAERVQEDAVLDLIERTIEAWRHVERRAYLPIVIDSWLRDTAVTLQQASRSSRPSEGFGS